KPRLRGGVLSSCRAGRSVRDWRLRIWREGRVLLHAAQEIEREMQLFVVLGLPRNVSGRARLLFLGVAGLEVATQRGLAAGLDLALQLVRQILDQLYVRRDAFGLNGAAGGSV